MVPQAVPEDLEVREDSVAQEVLVLREDSVEATHPEVAVIRLRLPIMERLLYP